jgi:hypothetical protein
VEGINARNARGETALLKAVSSGATFGHVRDWMEGVLLLLGGGGDPSLPDCQGETPLMRAAAVQGIFHYLYYFHYYFHYVLLSLIVLIITTYHHYEEHLMGRNPNMLVHILRASYPRSGVPIRQLLRSYSARPILKAKEPV